MTKKVTLFPLSAFIVHEPSFYNGEPIISRIILIKKKQKPLHLENIDQPIVHKKMTLLLSLCSSIAASSCKNIYGVLVEYLWSFHLDPKKCVLAFVNGCKMLAKSCQCLIKTRGRVDVKKRKSIYKLGYVN